VPTVALFVESTVVQPGDLLFLTCTVLNDGGGTVSRFTFATTTGGATLTQDGGATATALVPSGLGSIIYTCAGENEAGVGPDSAPLIVDVIN